MLRNHNKYCFDIVMYIIYLNTFKLWDNDLIYFLKYFRKCLLMFTVSQKLFSGAVWNKNIFICLRYPLLIHTYQTYHRYHIPICKHELLMYWGASGREAKKAVGQSNRIQVYFFQYRTWENPIWDWIFHRVCFDSRAQNLSDAT